MSRNFPFTIYTSHVDSTLWKKCSFSSKNVSSIKKLLISKVESFVKSNFDTNKKCKIILTQNHYIWSFSITNYFFVFIKRIAKYLKVMENVKNWGLKEIETSYDQKFVCLDSPEPFFYSWHFQCWFNFVEKVLILLKRVVLSKNYQ